MEVEKMRIENSWIRFDEEEERITGKKGKIKTNRHGTLYFEIQVAHEGICRININDYIANIINHIDSEYVTIICKDADRNYCMVVEAETPLEDDMPSLAFDEMASSLKKRELLLSLARVIELYDNIEYTDENISSFLTELQEYLETLVRKEL
jgi:hypothetical protein